MPAFYENKIPAVISTRGTTLTPSPHLHDHLELVYLEEGETYAVSDDKKEKMEAGDVFLSFPNQIHAYPYDGLCGAKKHIIIIFSPRVCSEFKGMFQQSVPLSPVVRAAELDPEVPALIRKVYEEQKKGDPYKAAVVRGYLIVCLGKLFASMEFREERQTDGSLLKSVLNYCNRNYTEDLSLDRVAAELNVGKYHISHVLGEKLKVSFPDYVNGLRINDAIRRLTQDETASVTDVAYDCGFGSTRTFNRAFRKMTGTTPREYREANKNQKVVPLNFYVNE